MQNRPQNSRQFERNGKTIVLSWLAAFLAGLLILLVVGLCLNFFSFRVEEDQPPGQIAGTTMTDGVGQGGGVGEGQGEGSGDVGDGQAGPMGIEDGVEDGAAATQTDETSLAESDVTDAQPGNISRIDLDQAKPVNLGLVDEELQTDPRQEIPALAGKTSPARKGTTNPALQGQAAPKSIFQDEKSSLAKRIVYIIDSSGSMTGGRLDLAKKELKNSLKSLKKSQEFYIIFFSSSAMEMPSGKMLTGVPLNRKKAEDWMKKIKPYGGTRVAAAMKVAVSKNPDLIWLLTDGEIRDPHAAQKILDAYRRENPEQEFRLNTIAFIEPKGERLLKYLAEKYGGSYKFVGK